MSELAERVTRLERRMDEVHDLASSTDREVAGWRGVLKNHTIVLNGMSERLDQFERKVDKRFDKVEAEMHERFTQMREGFTKLGLGQAQITALLNIVIDKSDDK